METREFVRLETIEADNLWFIRKEFGGYSPCIKGKPLTGVNGSENGKYCIPNCVGGAYAFESFLHNNPTLKLGFDNSAGYPYTAKYWWKCKDGWTKSSTPVLGAVVCWDSASSTGSGHVAVVSKVYADGTFDTLESSYGNASRRWRSVHYDAKATKNGCKLQGFKVSPYYTFVESVVEEETVTYSVGDKVLLISKGWTREIKRIDESKAPAKYLLGNEKGLTGWYSASEISLVVSGEKNEETKVEEVVTPVLKSVDEIAAEVIDGKWGNGNNRKKALIEAGYDYDAVQAKVVELLKKQEEEKKAALKSVSEIADEVIAGKWGNGAVRKSALVKAGYDYDAVQAEVIKRIAVYYTVVRGDTLTSIAKKYKTNTVTIKKLNNMKTTKIVVGQKLRVK